MRARKHIAKRELAAWMCVRTGITGVLERIPKRRGLMVLSYHRIGNPSETSYDPSLFSATAEQFEFQIRHLKRHSHIISLDEALHQAGSADGAGGAGVLMTFDDGYLDNYTQAFPILKSYGIPAVFFLPTAFIGTGRLPWWDVIAYILKHSRRKTIELHGPELVKFSLDDGDLRATIRRVLSMFKQSCAQEERFISDLENQCDCPRPQGERERRFLNWEEAVEMQESGMAFGSHTHSHEILAGLSPEQQYAELVQSREILERQLRRPIDVLAYPVGGRNTFSAETTQAVERAGYRWAFSNYGGYNVSGRISRFDIHRFGCPDPLPGCFRLQMSIGGLTGAHF